MTDEEEDQSERAEEPAEEKPKPPGITPEQAAKVLKLDMANMVKKVADGRTLSTTERTLVQSLCSQPVTRAWADTQVELAMVLGVDRKTIQRWIKEEGNPSSRSDGRYSVSEWKEWARKNDKHFEDEDSSQTELKAKQILLQNQKLEYQLGIIRKDYVLASDVERWSGEMGAAVRKIVCQLHTLASSLHGSTFEQIEEMLRSQEDSILEQMHLVSQRMDQLKNEPVD